MGVRWGLSLLLTLIGLSFAATPSLARAQPAVLPALDRSGGAKPSDPDRLVELRLTQVITDLPAVHVYSLAIDDRGAAVSLPSDSLSLQIGARRPLALSRGGDDGIATILLVDVSRSLTSSQFEQGKGSLKAWIQDLRPNDFAALVTFGSEVRTKVDFTNDKNRLSAAVDALSPADDTTLLYQGLVQAVTLARSSKVVPSNTIRRAIVLVTDGLDDQAGGAGLGQVRDQLNVDPIPIYALGLAAHPGKVVDAALKNLADLAVESGGEYARVTPSTLTSSYARLQSRIRSVQHFIATCPDCPHDRSSAVLQLTMPSGVRSSPVTVRFVGPAEDPHKKEEPGTLMEWARLILDYIKALTVAARLTYIIWAAVAAAGATTAVVYYVRRRAAQHEPHSSTAGNNDGGVFVVIKTLIPLGSHRDRQRLRLDPLGRNDIELGESLFERELTLGRSPDNDIYIGNDGMVSGSHCSLVARDGKILVRDLGSRNGTRVNGVPIKGFIHAESDSILGVGRTEIRMRLLPAGVA